jgi:hypothetical protein
MSKNNFIRAALSVCALGLISVRFVRPDLKIDAVTIGLLVVAVLPWLSGLLDSAKFPGGWEVKFRDLESTLKDETSKIRSDIVKNAEGIPAAISYELGRPNERVLYNSLNRRIEADFQGKPGRFYKKVDGKDMPFGIEGKGIVKTENGVLRIERPNTDGRYEITLQSYDIDGTENDVIAQTPDPVTKRRIRISCEARAIGGEHTLRFVLKGLQTSKWLASDERRVSVDEWVTLSVYFLVNLTETCRLRIDDEGVTISPSAVEIRNIVLAERTA